MGLAILFSCTHICVNFALFQPHIALFLYLAHTSPETAQISICFRLSGTFAMTVLNRRNERYSASLFCVAPSVLYFRANKRTAPDFPHSQKKKQRKEMSNTNRTERTSCEQDKPYCQRDWWLCSLVRRILKYEAKKKYECGTFFFLS